MNINNLPDEIIGFIFTIGCEVTLRLDHEALIAPMSYFSNIERTPRYMKGFTRLVSLVCSHWRNIIGKRAFRHLWISTLVLNDDHDPSLSLAEYLSDLQNSDGADLDILWQLYRDGDLLTDASWTTTTISMRLFLHGMERTLPYRNQIRFLGAGINSPLVMRSVLSFVTEISAAERLVWLGLYSYMYQVMDFNYEVLRCYPDDLDPVEIYGFHQPCGVCDLSKCQSLMHVELRGVCPSHLSVSKDADTLGLWLSSTAELPFEYSKLKSTISGCRSLKELKINLDDTGHLPKIGSLDAHLSIPTLRVLTLGTSLDGVAFFTSFLKLEGLHTLIFEQLDTDSQTPAIAPITLPQLRTLIIRGATEELLRSISMWKLERLQKLCLIPEYWSLSAFYSNKTASPPSFYLKCPPELEINYDMEQDLIWLVSHMDTEHMRFIRTRTHDIENMASIQTEETTRIRLSNVTKILYEGFEGPLPIRHLEFPSVRSLDLPHGITSCGSPLSNEIKEFCSRILALRIAVFGDYDNIPTTLTAFPHIENLTLVINRWEILLLLFQENQEEIITYRNLSVIRVEFDFGNNWPLCSRHVHLEESLRFLCRLMESKGSYGLPSLARVEASDCGPNGTTLLDPIWAFASV